MEAVNIEVRFKTLHHTAARRTAQWATVSSNRITCPDAFCAQLMEISMMNLYLEIDMDGIRNYGASCCSQIRMGAHDYLFLQLSC